MIMKKILGLILIIAMAYSCTPPEVGYLSDNIHALEDTIFVPRGVFMTSAAPNPEGSTYPLHWEFKSITDENGNETDALFQTHEILIWKEAFNGDTDTTLELAKKKLELSEEPSILLNDVSGEMAFTQASKAIDKPDVYIVNMLVSNIKGQKELDDYVVIKLGDFTPVEFTSQMRSRVFVYTVDGKKKILNTKIISGPYDDQIPDVLAGTHPYFRITKESAEPNLALKWNMYICDSHNKAPVPTSEVTFYPYGRTYLQNYHDNSVEDVDHGDYWEFNLPAPPMPQYSRQNWGDLMYYLSTKEAFVIDTTAYVADNGAVDWSQYEKDNQGNVICSAYIRWAIHINDSGTWRLEMSIPYTIKKN
jgi:hypothetical protein